MYEVIQFIITLIAVVLCALAGFFGLGLLVLLISFIVRIYLNMKDK